MTESSRHQSGRSRSVDFIKEEFRIHARHLSSTESAGEFLGISGDYFVFSSGLYELLDHDLKRASPAIIRPDDLYEGAVTIPLETMRLGWPIQFLPPKYLVELPLNNRHLVKIDLNTGNSQLLRSTISDQDSTLQWAGLPSSTPDCVLVIQSHHKPGEKRNAELVRVHVETDRADVLLPRFDHYGRLAFNQNFLTTVHLRDVRYVENAGSFYEVTAENHLANEEVKIPFAICKNYPPTISFDSNHHLVWESDNGTFIILDSSNWPIENSFRSAITDPQRPGIEPVCGIALGNQTFAALTNYRTLWIFALDLDRPVVASFNLLSNFEGVQENLTLSFKNLDSLSPFDPHPAPGQMFLSNDRRKLVIDFENLFEISIDDVLNALPY